MFGLDQDATVVLALSATVTFINVTFTFAIFVYFCCCIEVINFKNIYDFTAAIKSNGDKHTTAEDNSHDAALQLKELPKRQILKQL
jgi:hypothetical protein